MTAYVALLRGIGPATHAKMPLGKLAEACAAAGLDDVSVVGSTGNFVFSSAEPQAAVEALVTAAVKGFGLGNEVFTRTARQLQMLAGLAPFPAAAAERPDRLGICFFHKDPRWPKDYLGYTGPERIRMFSNHLIIDYGARIAVSRLTMEKTVGAHMTQRNWTSVLRIAGNLGVG
jgi:uncharacterized protein (DUF1697 family)